MRKMSIRSLAVTHGVSRALIYLWVHERRFPVYRLGGLGRRGRIMIEDEVFEQFLNTQIVAEGQVDDPGTLVHIHTRR